MNKRVIKMKKLYMFILIFLIYGALPGCKKSPVDAVEPEIIPYSGKIAFISDRDGNGEIYIMNIDGSNKINLTRNEGEDYAPVFQP
jgi:TolB protein